MGDFRNVDSTTSQQGKHYAIEIMEMRYITTKRNEFQHR